MAKSRSVSSKLSKKTSHGTIDKYAVVEEKNYLKIK